MIMLMHVAAKVWLKNTFDEGWRAWGLAGTIFGCLIFVLGNKWVFRAAYQFFVYSHVLLVAWLFVATWYHVVDLDGTNEDFKPYLISSIILCKFARASVKGRGRQQLTTPPTSRAHRRAPGSGPPSLQRPLDQWSHPLVGQEEARHIVNARLGHRVQRPAHAPRGTTARFHAALGAGSARIPYGTAQEGWGIVDLRITPLHDRESLCARRWWCW